MSVISFFGTEEKSWWSNLWDKVFSPFKKAVGVVTEPIFNMVIILCVFLVILFFIVKPKVGLKL